MKKSELLDRIEQLEKRVAELEKQQPITITYPKMPIYPVYPTYPGVTGVIPMYYVWYKL